MVKVLQFPVGPPYLRLRQIAGADGKGVISEWLAKYAAARAKFRVRTQHLEKFPRNEWNKKQFRHIANGLFEIKWKADNLQWRALGFDDAEGFFVMVLGCTHKQDDYDPRNCLETAAKKMGEAKHGKWRIIDYEHFSRTTDQGTQG